MILYDMPLGDGETPPKFAVVRLPQGDEWSPSAAAFLPAGTASDAVMAMSTKEPPAVLSRSALAYVPGVPECGPGETDAIVWIDPATGRRTTDPITPALPVATPAVAVSVSLAVAR